MPAKTKHTPESLAAQIRALAADLGRRPTSAEFISVHSVSSATLAKNGGWSALADEALADETAPAETTDEHAVRVHKLKEKARSARTELRAVVKDLERRNGELEEANAFLLGVNELKHEWTPQPIVTCAKKPRKGLPEATYVSLASDWHVEERVRPEQIGFRNEYNPEIAQERARQFWRSNLTMLNAARAAWHIDQYLLWLGGDLITGYIHEEYEADNYLSPTEATLLAFQMLVEGIDYLLAESDCPRILIATSNGNHGRTGKKKRVTDDFRNSYEFMLYQLLAMHYKDEKRIRFQLGTGYYNVVDVYGFEVRFSHGDAVRSGGGVGGLAPPLYRRIGKLAQGGDSVNLDCMGHHHQLDFLRLFARNGSLIGWNQFAEFLGCEPEPPQQASFVVDSKHQIACNMNPILVTK